MRQLEVVSVSDDGTQVLLASAEDARATHSVRIDNRLQAAIRGELDDSERRESELSPKEIQARLRAGETEEQVAKAAKVPIARVMRYAGPVISERDRIVDQARAAVLQRPRGPEATIALGDMVEKRLGATAGIRFETVAWTARRRDDGAWIVVLTYVARGGARTASWLWAPTERQLSSLNGLATRLGAEDLPPAVLRKRAAKRATSTRVAAKPRGSKRTASKSAATKRAAPKRVTASQPAAKAAAPPVVAARRVARRPAKPIAKPERVRREIETPVVEPAAKRTNGRVAVPSWSDVLLGVQAPAATRGRRRS